MEESDLFSSLSEADKAEGYRYDSLYIKPQPYNKGANPGCKPLVFVHMTRDERSGCIKDIGAFLPERCYTSDAVVKDSSYTRRGRDGWVALYIPVNLENNSPYFSNTCVMKAKNFNPIQFRINENKYLRCKTEQEALNTLIQFLAPIKFSLGGVTLVTYNEGDIKHIMRKISQFSLTQIFFNIVTDFLTVLGIVSLPTVPGSLQQMVTQYYSSLNSMVNNSAELSRVMAYIFAQNCQTFFFEGERKEFSVLEEYFTMNYEIKHDEGNEENLSLYVGDLSQKVRDNDLIQGICDKTGLQRSEFKVKMCMHPQTRVFLGYAYVMFKEHEAALKTLIRMNNENFFGRHMRVVWHNKVVIGSGKSNANLYIKFLPKTVDQKQLNEIFSVFGKVHSCKVQTDSDGFHKGVGFVQYDKEISAYRAIKLMHGMPIAGQPALYVSIKQTGEQRKGGADSGNERKFGDPMQTPQLRVHVTGNHSAVDLESIFQKFDSFGDVEFFKTCKDNDKKVVLLVFELIKDCESARREDGMHFLGARLEVCPYREHMTDFKEVVVKGERLYVGNIDPLSSCEDLKRLFSNIQDGPTPPVINTKIMRNSAGDSLQYGYVTLLPQYTQKAIQRFHGRDIGGYKLSVHLDEEEPGDHDLGGDDHDLGGVFARTESSDYEASTSKASSSKIKEVKKIDAKSMLANRLMNAMRKKAKGTPTSSKEPPKAVPKPMSEYGEDSSSSSSSLASKMHQRLLESSNNRNKPKDNNSIGSSISSYEGDYDESRNMTGGRRSLPGTARGFASNVPESVRGRGSSRGFGTGGAGWGIPRTQLHSGHPEGHDRGQGQDQVASRGHQDEFGRDIDISSSQGGFGRGGGSNRGHGRGRIGDGGQGGGQQLWGRGEGNQHGWGSNQGNVVGGHHQGGGQGWDRPQGGGQGWDRPQGGGQGWDRPQVEGGQGLDRMHGGEERGGSSQHHGSSRKRSRSNRSRSVSLPRRKRSRSTSRLRRSRGRSSSSSSSPPRRRKSSSSSSTSATRRRRNRSSSSSSSPRRRKRSSSSSSSPRRRKRSSSNSSITEFRNSLYSKESRSQRRGRNGSRSARRSPSYGRRQRSDSSRSSRSRSRSRNKRRSPSYGRGRARSSS